ncbi:PKD domain-containing protein [Taibaiella soli]|uniref:PKD domain-containing protein n=1 Tax=Taibaiella soli TaxID=1649169 RepID=A0A2W2AKF5_9BACT|nr:PKD domain-containing protein [Taibaiella soli]PZF72740.1 PKD domain-containing protein [Taibaiella soli]
MDLIQRTKKQIIGLTILLILFAGLLFVWLEKRVIHSNADLQVVVYPQDLTIGDTLHFADHTSFAKQHRWEFGDGGLSFLESDNYCYTKPGYYQLRLIVNNDYFRTINIHVKDRPKINALADSIATISAQTVAMQDETIEFRCNALDATSFRWKFGETGQVDSKEKVAFYSYKTPGDYTVSLQVNTNQGPVEHHIRILPSFKIGSDSISFDDPYQKKDNDFKQHLQQIANGNSFNLHYNYLLETYLCKNEKASVKINGSIVSEFYSYCARLRFDKNTTIQSVKCGFDDSLRCVTRVDVQQGK